MPLCQDIRGTFSKFLYLLPNAQLLRLETCIEDDAVLKVLVHLLEVLKAHLFGVHLVLTFSKF